MKNKERIPVASAQGVVKKEQIQQLIENYKLSKQEVFNCLDELNKIDSSKLDYKENDSLRESIIRHEESHYLHSIIINDLENIL